LAEQASSAYEWLINYKQEESNYPKVQLSKKQIEFSHDQYYHAIHYNELNKHDLNYHLTTYVDLKYNAIWSDDFLK
jgi:hypothetical protein